MILILKHKYNIIAIILSFMLFEGLVGDDHYSVNKFIRQFNYFEGGLSDFLSIKGAYEWTHRFIWIVHDYVIISSLNNLFNLFNLNINFPFEAGDIITLVAEDPAFRVSSDNVLVLETKLLYYNIKTIYHNFIATYLTGWLLTLYVFIAAKIMYTDLNKYNNNYNLNFLVTNYIFVGTCLISFFEGVAFESLIILLFILRNFQLKYGLNILIDLIITLIKPYYFIIIIGIVFNDVNKINYRNKLYYCVFILCIYSIIRYQFINSAGLIIYLESFKWIFEINIVAQNIFDTIFSFSFGLLFTYSIPIYFIIIGYNYRKTAIKLIAIFLLIIFLSNIPFWYGGGVTGNRYLAPTIFIFLDEFRRGINIFHTYSYNFKRITLFLFCIFTILNITVLEYKNISLYEYRDGTVLTGTPTGVDVEDINYFPTYDISLHPVIFANSVLYAKIMNDNSFKYKNMKIPLANFYPGTGLGRLIYLLTNNLEYLPASLLNILRKFLSLFIASYILICILYIIIVLRNLHQYLKK